MLTQTREGGVAVLTLDYPERRNALAVPMRRALVGALEAIEGDRAVCAVVITGAGGTFCAGGDISGMDAADLAAGRERFRLSHALVRQLVRLRAPVIAAVEGHCVGAGLSLAMCCDTVIAAEDARFAAGFGRVGLMADLGLLHTLPAALARAAAFESAAPLPIALTKQMLSTGLDAALDLERELQSALFQTADHAEGKAAFLEKRPPRFSGR